MGAQTFNAAFVIWRESVEAFLVIGILNAWLAHRSPEDRKTGRFWLWAGVAAGLFGAALLAAVLLTLGDAFGDDAQGYFQAGVLFVAVALIVQMVMWMRREGRTLKANLHGSLNIAADQANWIGVFLLAALAVMREGSEAAIFLYGTMAGGAAFSVAGILSMVLGFLAALATYAALQVGGSMLSWRTFFRVTEVMLLFLAASLLVAGVDHLISLGILPPLSPRLWDTSHLLADSGPIGGLVSGFTGYRAKPALTELVAYGAYWSIILWMLSRPLAGRSA